eukprot:scaffold92193_cov24-Prasinocladus_malaysianus.AAC.1
MERLQMLVVPCFRVRGANKVEKTSGFLPRASKTVLKLWCVNVDGCAFCKPKPLTLKSQFRPERQRRKPAAPQSATGAHLHDGRADRLGAVDDLLDARHAERDVHASHPGEMEGLERHLRPGLPDGLRPKSPHLPNTQQRHDLYHSGPHKGTIRAIANGPT